MAGIPALVLGAEITGLAVLRALGRAGVPVLCGGARTHLVARSRWYRPAPGPLREDDLAAGLRALPLERAVLFPCTDHWAQAVAALPADVAAAFPSPLAAPEVLEVLVDKGRFAAACARLGVPAPRTLPADALGDLGDEELGRFFLKPLDSQAFSERRGVKALQVRDRAHAQRLLAELGEEVLLQERVEGPPAAHVFLDGYVDRGGVVRALLARRRLRSHPPRFGNSTLSRTVPLREVQGAVDSLLRLVEGLGYTGLFDAEFVHDARDGRFAVLEVNARPWWQFALAGASGLDLAGLAYRDALGLPLRSATGYRAGRTWVHPVPDLKAWWAARGRGGLPVRAWGGPADAVFAWDDPAPLAAELARAGRGAVRRLSG